MQPQGRTALLALAAMVAVVAVSISTAKAEQASSSKTIVRTWSLRWPATPDRSRYRVLSVPEPIGTIQRGLIYVNGSRVNSRFPGSDWIVACAHRGPAFASGTLHRPTGTVYALVVLTTGECLGGPSVAGTLARVKVVITYTPYQP
jgi:hypothetical protein